MQLQAGISGTKAEGSESIVVSGGYVDDRDLGDVIIYTGHGGQDGNGRQIRDQSIDDRGNAALITSEVLGLPVRVIRGRHRGNPYAPTSGFRYDGLYAVVGHWMHPGAEGFSVVQYRLEKLPDDAPAAGPAPQADAAAYSTTTVTRRVRDSAVSRQVKAWHKDQCQVCGVTLEVDGDRHYSEGAHIRPLGKPHDGPDTADNILCLCPNHHAQWDLGGLRIGVDLQVHNRITGAVIGTLRTVAEHHIAPDHLAYRLARFP